MTILTDHGHTIDKTRVITQLFNLTTTQKGHLCLGWDGFFGAVSCDHHFYAMLIV